VAANRRKIKPSVKHQFSRTLQSAGSAMGKLEFRNLRIEMLGTNAAFARGEYYLSMASNGERQNATRHFYADHPSFSRGLAHRSRSHLARRVRQSGGHDFA